MKKYWPLIGLILLLSIPLVLLLQGFARDVVLIEVLRLYWAGRLVVDAVPQLLLWGLFLLVVLFLAVRSLGRRQKTQREPDAGPAPAAGQVQTLARWIRQAGGSEYFRWTLAQHLAGLTWDVMAHREGRTPDELKQRLQAGRLDLPPVLEGYLRAAQAPPTAGAGLWPRVRARLALRPVSSPPDPALEDLVHYLESQLHADR